MNVHAAVRNYISKAVDDAGPGMKVLVMDEETTSIVSLVYLQSEILQKEVFLFEELDNPSREPMKHLKAVVFVRPTTVSCRDVSPWRSVDLLHIFRDNILLLCNELKNPRYNLYYIYFSNLLSKADLKMLAGADEHESVREVQEFFGDYMPITPHLFTFNMPCSSCGIGTWNRKVLSRCTSGLVSVLLSLKKNPLIRYQNNSEMAKQLAENVRTIVTREAGLFDFRKPEVQPLLLILDRRDDPVTPMLNQWTYQAMVHELLGIKNNVVDLSDTPDTGKKDLKKVVLSAEKDDFYAKSMYQNYGEIAKSIQDLMSEFQKKKDSQQKVESIDDMKSFVESYPEFKKISGAVNKHMSLVGELSRQVATNVLMDVSEVEQEIACHSDHAFVLQKIRGLITSGKMSPLDFCRVVMLYSLRYERHSNNDRHNLLDSMSKHGVPEAYRMLASRMIDYAGFKERSSDLFGTESSISITKHIFKGLKGVENVYTQHKPLLATILDNLYKGRLKEPLYPYLTNRSITGRPQDVLVFIVGGCTYEESATVHSFNRSTPGARVILGSTNIHNFKSFLDEVRSAVLPDYRSSRQRPGPGSNVS